MCYVCVCAVCVCMCVCMCVCVHIKLNNGYFQLMTELLMLVGELLYLNTEALVFGPQLSHLTMVRFGRQIS